MTTKNGTDTARYLHIFMIEGQRYAVDGNSGVFFKLDEIAAEALSLAVTGIPHEDIKKQLSQTHDPEKIVDTLVELDQIIADGIVFGPDPFSGDSLIADTGISTICLIVSQDCNLRCPYCYAKEGTFGRSRGYMSPEIAEHAVDFLIQQSGAIRELGITFFGGEPLLNLDTIKHTVEYARRKATANHKQVGFSMTTNATLLTPTVQKYILDNDIGLMVSLDGPREIHDSMRHFSDGRGSHNIVQNNLMNILKDQNRIPVAVRATMTRDCMELVQIAEHLWETGSTDVAVEPCLDPSGTLGIRTEDLDIIKSKYLELARIYLNSACSGRYVPFYQFEEFASRAGRISLRPISCGAALNYLAVSADGSLYPCHKMIEIDDYRLGDVYTGITKPEIVEKIRNLRPKSLEKCSGCWARYICGGGCRAHSLIFNQDITKPCLFDCEMSRYFTELGAFIFSELNSYGDTTAGGGERGH